MADRPAEVTTPTYAGVRVDHPEIVKGTRRALRRGYPMEEIVKRIGMPYEVVDRIRQEMKRK